MAEYNADAVQAEIDKDKTIGKQEGKAIHALLKGRARGMTCVQCGGLALGYAVENENREIVCRECDDDRFLAIIAELEREKKEKDMAKEQQDATDRVAMTVNIGDLCTHCEGSHPMFGYVPRSILMHVV